jgi:plastocyanin
MRRPAAVLAILAILAILALVGPGAPAGAQDEGPYGGSVSAIDDVFTPEIVRVAPGETVEWSNDGRSAHTVDADDGGWSSGNLAPGGTFERRFDAPGVYTFFCRYHGRPGAGMAGTVVVGDAPLPGGASPERDPVPAGPAGTVRVPRDAPTVQEAVDRARPGGLVLISPGLYREAVVVTTPYLTIRGVDRERTILDGGFELANGIHVVEADGVSIENLTARRYLLNGFYWSGVFGYRGSYLTAATNGDYGVYAFDSRYGRIEHSYASGSPDAGFYIGACSPCDAVITDVLAEHNALGYSGTNAGGNLAIVNSEWRSNLAGIVPNTLDSEPFAPQRGALIAGNHVHHNASTTVDAKDFGSVPFGIGIVVAGGRDDRIVGNLVEDQSTYGIGIGPFLDVHFWPASGNVVTGNVIRRSGRADLALAAPAGSGDCFEDNDAWSSQPAAVELLYPCHGFRPFPLGGGSMAPTINALSRYVESLDGGFPHGDWREQPGPPPGLPGMPGDPAAAPPDPAIPGDVVPGTYRIRDVSEIRPTSGPAIGKEVGVMGVPLAATTWWSLLLGLYGYVLPFVLLAAWVAIALWDLIRRDDGSKSTAVAWIAVILVVPFVGPLVYFAFGGSRIPAPIRVALTAGGAAAYLLFLVVGLLLGG